MLLIAGLVLGFHGASVSTVSFGQVSCGSAFAPHDPSFVDGLTLEPNATDPLGNSTELLSDRCAAAASSNRGPAVTLLALGILGLVACGVAAAMVKPSAAVMSVDEGRH